VNERPTAEAIRLARERLDLSQTKFGQLLGVRQATISDWETGAVEPSISLARMQELLQDATPGGVRPDLMLDPRSYSLGVLTGIEGDARSTLAKIAEARRVLGATPAVGGPRDRVADEARGARKALAPKPKRRAAGGSSR
jgi:DNA-binding XRE family transcriptional regulator